MFALLQSGAQAPEPGRIYLYGPGSKHQLLKVLLSGDLVSLTDVAPQIVLKL